ncbi:GNAT family N-acetyltransferase [Streptoalloteichus tenebrarius]|uniref:GNAT family N-acetyltransferase n=1 Tax=Streptoalloteichus tenebrarius (strain ATCC 17920 / DSM 40477 / JCM 4838 / CBS 697.72 / NBRC 16177 / NCIMB 11028 / NRRL B-12390 / A12253. 1 / ISP 5477) TaxID=1933 RepID=UPI0035EFE07E
MSAEAVRLVTERPGLELRSLRPEDGAAYARLMWDNAAHLTRHGDYVDMVAASAEDHAATFSAGDPLLNFGVYEDDRLVGRVELVVGEPPKYGLGYLLAEHACGRGLATTALRALVRHARSRLSATDLFAGVTRGNHPSVAVLRRLGFTRVASFDTYDRYHLDLITPGEVGSGPGSPPTPSGP